MGTLRRNPQSESAQIRGKLHGRLYANPEPTLSSEEGVETERAAPKGQKLKVKRQSRPQTACQAGDENRSGMNPGAAGSSPAVDTIV
ncbi:hypothetical protein MF1_12750 [Bartonella quintana]|uniref:hypothetical protein n=1 Tax=Bartonella quintana TaxID=803 RepID=UPI000306EFA9|nr:hypothetical protein [Bartonella quintana]BBL54017.1 hypothetical protein MF1_12750 [Bartonella quintana]